MIKITQTDNNVSADIDLRPNFKMYMNFLINDCKITKPLYVCSRDDEDKIKTRSLYGNERLKIFTVMFQNGGKMQDIFKNSKIDLKIENNIWKVFFRLYLSIKYFPSDLNEFDLKKYGIVQYWLFKTVPIIEKELKDWLNLF